MSEEGDIGNIFDEVREQFMSEPSGLRAKRKCKGYTHEDEQGNIYTDHLDCGCKGVGYIYRDVSIGEALESYKYLVSKQSCVVGTPVLTLPDEWEITE